ncbi:MAG: NADPH-dependent FMN reductase [Acidimicrobiia bacterium]
MRIASLCGSLGPGSANAAALSAATATLARRGVEVVAVDGLDEVPAFRADCVDDPPAPVRRLRDAFEAGDGVMIAAPEYAGGLAGAVKNALDWCVGSASLYRRPVAVLSAGTTGGAFAVEELVRTLSWQGALTVATLGIASPNTKRGADGTFTDTPTLRAIGGWADTLADAVTGPGAERLALVARAVEPYGIDPARFGELA